MSRRWFQDKWPWLLAIPPAFAVLGGIAILYLASATSDGLVAEDYYQRGITINESLAPASIRQQAPPRKEGS
jgi:hypothetical protein